MLLPRIVTIEGKGYAWFVPSKFNPSQFVSAKVHRHDVATARDGMVAQVMQAWHPPSLDPSFRSCLGTDGGGQFRQLLTHAVALNANADDGRRKLLRDLVRGYLKELEKEVSRELSARHPDAYVAPWNRENVGY